MPPIPRPPTSIYPHVTRLGPPVGPPVPHPALNNAQLALRQFAIGGMPRGAGELQPPAPPPYPGYMSAADQLAEAQKEAEIFFAPQLAQAQYQQRMLHNRDLAQQLSIQDVFKALSGMESGPQAQIAGNQGQLQYLSAVQQGNQAEQDMAQQVLGLTGQQGAKAQDILAQLQSAQAGYQKDYATTQRDNQSFALSLYNAGFLTQRDLAKTLGFPNANAYPNTPKTSAAAPRVYGSATAGYFTLDPVTGKKTVVSGPVAPPDHYTATAGGDVLDTSTGQVVGRVTVKPSAPGKPTYWTDKAGNRHMTTGQGVDNIIVPSGSVANPPKPVSAKAMQQARAVLASIGPPRLSRVSDPNTPLSKSQLNTIVNTYNAQVNAYNKANKSKTNFVAAPTITAAHLINATDAQLAKLGLSRQTALSPQQAYLKMVQLGVSARQAWQMVRRKYPGWGAGYFSGKGSAAQGAAYNPRQAQATTQPASYTDWPMMIQSGAAHYGLDPAAVLAVARAEGLGGGVGDSGTSFGPFQLHVGGALPRGKNQAWAESPAGIDYALRQIARVARGKTGLAAVTAIVHSFERPADPTGEVARAMSYYYGGTV